MLEFVKETALQAGQKCLQAAEQMDRVEIAYKGAIDLVTSVDREVERFIRGEIERKFPAHQVVGEEDGESGTSGTYRWFIDPIDGTNSFIHGLPGFCVSISCEKDGEPEVAAIYAPVLKQLFSAERGAGAYLNGEKLQVTTCTRLIESIWATGFACVRGNLEKNNLDNFSRILPEIRDFRRMGSAALDLAWVAAGRLDGYWELGVNRYDVSAGILLVEEAGGSVCDMSGAKRYPEDGIVASNGYLTESFLSVLRNGDSG